MVVFLWLCPFSLFIQYRTPSNEMVLSIFGVVFQSLVKLLWKLPQKNIRRGMCHRWFKIHSTWQWRITITAFVQTPYSGFCFILFIFCFFPVWPLHLGACCFLKRKWSGRGDEWRGERGSWVEGGKTVVEMYCVPEESIFNKNFKNNTFKWRIGNLDTVLTLAAHVLEFNDTEKISIVPVQRWHAN